LNQTYHNKELIILSQGDDAANQEIEEYVARLNRPDILFETAPAHLSLGAMRNASCELATGEILCQWDDDDLYHPCRLSAQYQAIREHRSNVASAHTSFLKYFQDCGEVYWCDWSGEGCPTCKLLPGSVMFYKWCFHRYGTFYPIVGDQCHVEEDLNVLEKLFRKGRVAPVNSGHLYVYVFHGKNTYNRSHHQLTLDISSGKKVLSVEELEAREHLLMPVFEGLGLGVTKVMSLDGLAFTYDP
jgi:glycosyltransferase involved in cell wall biosynthesis